jgi:hypothetical protein
MSKITRFPVPQVEEEEELPPPRFPDMPTIESMLMGKQLQSVLVMTVNSDGDVSHYIDGASTVEAIGMVEMLKQLIFFGDTGEVE